MICINQYKWFAFFALLCFAFTTQAQLSIEKHTKVAVDTYFTSLEDFNYIYADIKGEGKFIFNSTEKQELTTSYLTHFPNVSIQNSKSFLFNTAIQIDGNLKLNAKLVNIYSPIYIKGQLQVADHTKILGKDNIQIQTQFQTQQFPFSNQQQTTDISFGVDYTKNTHTPTDQNFKNKKTTYPYNTIATYLLAIKIPTPPPEV